MTATTWPSVVAATERVTTPLANLGRIALVAAQLWLIVLAVSTFEIDMAQGFGELAPLVLVGFVVHALLPRRLRLPCFVLLSFMAAVVLLSPFYGLMLVIAGLALLGICHLPIPFGARVVLLLAAAATLVAARVEWLRLPGVTATVVVPVLGAMFMFRTVLYMYGLRHEEEHVGAWQRVAYFFLLPNVCYLLFPVVDYKTFRRTYYSREATEIYQKGVHWMLRGVLHLLLYRVVYLHLLPAPAEVAGLGGVVQHMLATYALYLKVSGQFHLIIGMLALFGFDLPETHHLYWLASSFTDYWRRINIYWKDFMMTVVYYPAMLRLRRLGMTAALVLATITVFLATWMLHSYQWFWQYGTFPLRLADGLFWTILCAMVVANSLREARAGRRRSRKGGGWRPRAALAHSAQVVGMLVLISVLWSFWSAPSLRGWWDLVARAGNSGPAAWALLALGVAAAVGLGVIAQWATSRGWKPDALTEQPPFWRSVGYSTVTAGILLLLGNPTVQDRLRAQHPATERVADAVASIQFERMNLADQEAETRGYYEGILASRVGYAAVRGAVGGDWAPLEATSAVRHRPDLLGYELLPDQSIDWQGVRFTTNEWGMRDRSYSLVKPEGTYRVALLGASYTMGPGVVTDSTFENRVEDRLRRDGADIEILNFSVSAYSVVQSAFVLTERALAFDPDAVAVVVSPIEPMLFGMRFAKVLETKDRLGIPGLDSLLSRAGVGRGMSAVEIQRRLQPMAGELIDWSLRAIAEVCEARGIARYAIFHSLTDLPDWFTARREATSRGVARALGFTTMSMSGAFEGRRTRDIVLAPQIDNHPNDLGHRLLADRLYAELTASGGAFGVTSAAAAGAAAADAPLAGQGPR